ncbi:MAG: class I SAM-dependent methyltransferase, partial [Planctomycetota bacterium]|nr:class I SAM-dependent methyltransferase [Planctomycetota bacterium]
MASSKSSEEVAWSATDLSSNPHEAADKAQRVQRMFTSIAKSYDLNNRVHSFGIDQRWRRKVVQLCQIKPEDHVLDVACGTGDLSQAFADQKPASVV